MNNELHNILNKESERMGQWLIIRANDGTLVKVPVQRWNRSQVRWAYAQSRLFARQNRASARITAIFHIEGLTGYHDRFY